MWSGKMSVCQDTIDQASSPQGGDLVGILNKLTSINKLPLQKVADEMHIPGMNFAGPKARLDLRLNDDLTPKQWSEPVDRVDLVAYHHDLEYAELPDTSNRNAADRLMLNLT
jgi:microcystin degradation protein MlrC